MPLLHHWPVRVRTNTLLHHMGVTQGARAQVSRPQQSFIILFSLALFVFFCRCELIFLQSTTLWTVTVEVTFDIWSKGQACAAAL